MILNSIPSLRYAQADEFAMDNDAYCHCKTIPYYIFAQAFEGHYEIDANGEFAVCEEGGAFFVPPDTPLKIWHYVNKKSGIMRVRFVHFIPEDAQRLDPFFFLQAASGDFPNGLPGTGKDNKKIVGEL